MMPQPTETAMSEPDDFADPECDGCAGGDKWPVSENPWRCPVCDTEYFDDEKGVNLTDTPTADTARTDGPTLPAPNTLIDLIGEFGREVFYLLDDCETSGDVGEEVHTITDHGLVKVSAVLDRIDALPFEEPGYILGTGAKLQAALKKTFTAEPDKEALTALLVGFAIEAMDDYGVASEIPRNDPEFSDAAKVHVAGWFDALDAAQARITELETDREKGALNYIALMGRYDAAQVENERLRDEAYRHGQEFAALEDRP